jgi:hypothetical protein
MLEELIMQLEEHGLSEAEQIISNRQRRPRFFAKLAKKWAKAVDNVVKFDQFSMYTADEYENDIDSRVLLAEMQIFLPAEGKKISDMILAPLDDVFFRETILSPLTLYSSSLLPRFGL